MSTRPAKNVLGTSFSLSFRKGFKNFFFLLPVWSFRLFMHFIALLPLFFVLSVKSSPLGKTVPWFGSVTAFVIFTLATALLYLFFVFPLLFSKAEVIIKILHDQPFSLWHIFSFTDYSKKLKASFSHILSVLPWCLPLLVLGGYLYRIMTSNDGFFAFFNTITTFLGPTISIKNTLLVGVAIILFVILIAAYGILRNSSYSYAFVLFADRSPKYRKATNQSLKGHRLEQAGMGFIRFLANLPFYATLIMIVLAALYGKVPGLFSFVSFLPKLSYETTPWLLSATVGGLALTLLFAPFRMIFPAYFIGEVKN